MAERKVSDEELIKLLQETGSPSAVSKITGLSMRQVYSRRDVIEKKHQVQLPSFAAQQHSITRNGVVIPENRRQIDYELRDGVVVCFSDAHYWPGEPTVAHLALIEVCRDLKPQLIVANGDVYDGARISRHEPLYGHNTPTPKQELDAVKERLAEIESVSKGAYRFWTIGNHDVRFWRYMTVNAPEVAECVGTGLWEHFGGWEHGWSMYLNQNTMIKHRWHNGVHATYNNTLKSGVNIVTGHLHRLCVTPWADYNGRRYGVDTGTLAEPYGDQFLYTENNPVPWCSGFAVLTYKDGQLLPPELCEVTNDRAYFRGQQVI